MELGVADGGEGGGGTGDAKDGVGGGGKGRRETCFLEELGGDGGFNKSIEGLERALDTGSVEDL